MFCDQCGAKVPDNMQFCTSCGNRLDGYDGPEGGEDSASGSYGGTSGTGQTSAGGYSQGGQPHTSQSGYQGAGRDSGAQPHIQKPGQGYGQSASVAGYGPGPQGMYPRIAPGQEPPKKKGAPTAVIVAAVSVVLIACMIATVFVVKNRVKGKLEEAGIDEIIDETLNGGIAEGNGGEATDTPGYSDDNDDFYDENENRTDGDQGYDTDGSDDEDNRDAVRDLLKRFNDNDGDADTGRDDGQYDEDDRSDYDDDEDDSYTSGRKSYILAGSDTELLDKEDLQGISDEDLRLAINEIYARHGRKFKDQALQNYFEGKDWYIPKYDPDEFDKKQNELLNDVEKKNLKLLTEIRSARNKQ